MHPSLDRAERHAHGLGDFLVAHFLSMKQAKRSGILAANVGQCQLNFLAQQIGFPIQLRIVFDGYVQRKRIGSSMAE